MGRPGAHLEGPRVKLEKEAPLEPSLAPLRRGLDDITPRRSARAQLPPTFLNVNFKKGNPGAREGGKRIQGRQKGKKRDE